MSGFANQILGGAQKLIRRAIASPNYTPGTSGWSINKDGTAEFVGLILRTGASGSYIVIGANGNEIDFYSGVAGESAPGYIRVTTDGGPPATDGLLEIGAPALGGAVPRFTLDTAPTPSNCSASIESPGSFSFVADVAGEMSAPLLNMSATSGGISLSGGAGGLTLDGGAGGANLTGTGGVTIAGGGNIAGAWTAFTPTWTGSVSNPSLGNGARQSRYLVVGKLGFFRIRYVFGTTTTFGSGAWGFSLPFTPTTNSEQSVSALYSDDSATSRFPGSAWITSTAGVFRCLVPAGGAGASSSTPFTWAANDQLLITGCVELD